MLNRRTYLEILASSAGAGIISSDRERATSARTSVSQRAHRDAEYPAKLAADESWYLDEFGDSVALDGDTALVGAPYRIEGALPSVGIVFVFERSGANWHQRGKLALDTDRPNLRFGDAVALDSDTALVGAPNREDSALTGAPNKGNTTDPPGGEAHVFERSDGEWIRRARFTVDGDGIDHAFGRTVALDGDTAIVGSQDNDVHGWKSGAAFVFERTADGWHRQAMLVPDDGDRGHRFGQTVVLQDDRAVIAASTPGADSSAPGWVYVFERSEGEWSQHAKLTPEDVAESDRFRTSIAFDGDSVVIGANGADNSSASSGGVAHVFEHRNGRWRHERTFSPDGVDNGDRFGTTVAISGDLLLVAAPGDEGPSGTDVGAVYVYERTSEGWVRRARRAHDGKEFNDDFGQSVALDRGRAIVTVPSESQPNGGSGAAYVYDLGHLTSTETDDLGNDFRPMDVDGDGLYEDVNGDGEATPGDASVLFDRIFEDNSTVSRSDSRFDFNGDGHVTPGDATVLFDETF